MPTGSADADKIVMNQMTGDFTAEGHVTSTRLPDKKKNDSNGGGMLSEDEPLHARAKKMISKDNNLDIRYEGDAVLWQGADRLEAETVEIDRDNNLLKAHGHVLSQLLDKTKETPKGHRQRRAKRRRHGPSPKTANQGVICACLLSCGRRIWITTMTRAWRTIAAARLWSGRT